MHKILYLCTKKAHKILYLCTKKAYKDTAKEEDTWKVSEKSRE